MKHLFYKSGGLFVIMIAVLTLVILMAVILSCSPVHYTTTQPPKAGNSMKPQNYVVEKITEHTGPGMVVKLQGVRGRWFFPSDTLKVGDSVTILFYNNPNVKK